MTVAERQVVLDLLAQSEACVWRQINGLAIEQWMFRETAERWSIAEIVEHLVVFEEFIRGAVIEVLRGTAEPEKADAVRAKEPLVMGLGKRQGRGIQARAALRPTGRWTDMGAMVLELQRSRARTMAFAGATQADLREHFFPHIAFGDLDCYQWLLVIGTHTERHARQMEEIKLTEGFPRLSDRFDCGAN